MTLEVISGAAQISDALGELAREVARGVVLVRGSMGSSGSGVIWDQPGLVITNHHVVPGALAELTVAGGRRVRARVVRRAPALDLAALEVEGSLANAARVGDSDRLRVGDLVVAVGNPMGERNAPSLGILASAADEVLRLSITLRPGNSGGALVNARGEIVGIPHMVTGNGLALAVSTRSVGRFLNGATGEVEEDHLRWI
ncbi:MAG: trypsin-like peptidase domain-containing protein [Chloroflexi bacterium]|nr:MAG: trypsin-like peptidase domain-containing protein [Chloroflexota bacterium]